MSNIDLTHIAITNVLILAITLFQVIYLPISHPFFISSVAVIVARRSLQLLNFISYLFFFDSRDFVMFVGL